MGELKINKVFGLFRDVFNHIAQSMPAGIGDPEYSRITQYTVDKRTENNQRIWQPNPDVMLKFGKIWREGEWNADLVPEYVM